MTKSTSLLRTRPASTRLFRAALVLTAIAFSKWAWASCYTVRWAGSLAGTTAESVRMPIVFQLEGYGPNYTDDEGNDMVDAEFLVRGGESLDRLMMAVRLPAAPDEPTP